MEKIDLKLENLDELCLTILLPNKRPVQDAFPEEAFSGGPIVITAARSR